MFLWLLLSPLLLAAQRGSNIVKGEVHMVASPSPVQKGNHYNKDGTAIMHSDDPMAHPDHNIIVSLHPLSFSPEVSPTENAVITQKEQTFLPHVLPITRGSTIYFVNEDQFFHNVYSLSPGNRFNIGRRPPGNSYPIEIKKSGIFKLSCDIHSHMNAVILSLDTPYFTRVTEQGTFEINQLPDGLYRLEVYHPRFKKKIDHLSLSNGQVISKKFSFNNL